MRGFIGLGTLQKALRWIDQQARVLNSEVVSLAIAHSRTLSEEIICPIDIPPFDRALLDGYAVRGTETIGAGTYNPLTFSLLGESAPGCPFKDNLLPGTAVRIMAGGEMPEGADAVIPAEYAEENAGQVEITTAIAPGENVARMGMEIRQGDCLLQSGQRLWPPQLALLASIGINQIGVVRQPRVRIIVIGDELVPPGQPRGPYQVFDANTRMLESLTARDGGLTESACHAPDDPELIRKRLLAPGADILLVAGRTGVGVYDYAPNLLDEEGELAMHGIALWPAKSTGLGRIGETLVFLLPGEPVSCLCAYDLLAGRALRLMGGRCADWPYGRREAMVAKKIVSPIGQADYCRVRLFQDRVEPVASGPAPSLYATASADGFVLIPEEYEGYPPGATVTVHLYPH